MEAVRMRYRDLKASTMVLAVLALVATLVGKGSAGTKIIYSFGGDTDGEYGAGTVFELSRSGNGWIHAVLYSFTGGVDGGEPYKGVTLDAKGNLYGTAVTGGTGLGCEGGCGVVYKLTKSGKSWVQSVIYSFNGGDDGSGPGSGVTFDKSDTLFGMT